MGYCIFCKEIVNGRYSFRLEDKELGIVSIGLLCKNCYDRLLEMNRFVLDR